MSETIRTDQEHTDRTHRKFGRGIAALRILFGLIYLSNAIAKLFGVNNLRVGPIGGSLIDRDSARNILDGAANDTWIPTLGALYQDLVLGNWSFFAWFLTVAEFAIAFGLLFGIATRLAALGALLLIAPIWLMLLNETPYLWTYPVELVPLVILVIVPAGRIFGLDRSLARRFNWRWPF